jgi:hypothetical protein
MDVRRLTVFEVIFTLVLRIAVSDIKLRYISPLLFLKVNIYIYKLISVSDPRANIFI